MATLTSTISGFTRDDLTAETKVIPIPFTSLRQWDHMAVNLPESPTADDCGLATDTPGTDALEVITDDPGGTSVTQKFAFEFVFPPEYVAAGPAAIRVKGLTKTTACDASSTVDFQVYLDGRDGTVGSDIMSSTAFNINNTTAQQSDMAITASSLTSGSRIIIVGTMASVDAGNLGAMVPTLQALEMVISVKG